MTSLVDFGKIIKDFNSAIYEFQVLFGDLNISNEQKLLVLDASFNPPHLGHYHLVKAAYNKFRESNPLILLLLSLSNADKALQPAAFDKRLAMMYIMASLLLKEGINTSVALTVHAKFVDKSKCIRKHQNYDGTIVYLVGFDTIIRIFNPKYYTPLSIESALGDFMEETEFFCLTRHDSTMERNEQLTFIHNTGRETEYLIPPRWVTKIHMEPNSPEYECISSTDIRKRINDDTVTSVIPGPILSYIRNESKEKDIFET